jgi:hypothetical protein
VNHPRTFATPADEEVIVVTSRADGHDVSTRYQRDGFVLCPVTMVELSPAFAGSLETQKHFLEQVGIDFTEGWTFADTECAHRAWNAYVQARRA